MWGGGYNPFWSQHCPARYGADLKHIHETNCTDGHVAGQCCECGLHAKDFSKQIPAPPPDPLTVFPSEDDLPLKYGSEQFSDYETGARAVIIVDSWPPKVGHALKFLKWRHERGNLS